MRAWALTCLGWLGMVVAVTGLPALADTAIKGAPSYKRISMDCGGASGQKSYSQTEYVKAMADADKALKDARKAANRNPTEAQVRVEAIQGQISRMKECQAEEKIRVPPPATDCKGFVRDYNAFKAASASTAKSGSLSASRVEAMRQSFKPAIDNCLKELSAKCVDPYKDSSIDLAINSVHAISEFRGILMSGANMNGISRFIIMNGRGKSRLRLCSETDYKCKVGNTACEERARKLKEIIENAYWSDP